MSVMMMNDLQVRSGVLAVKPEALMQRIHTPPQVDVSASKNRKIENRKRTPVLFISSENAHISPSQQITVIDSSFLSPGHKFLIDIKFFSTIHLRNMVAIFASKIQVCGRQYSHNNDVQMSSLPIERMQEDGEVIADASRQSEPVCEGGQKKDGKRPPPGKPDTSKKEEPGREGDKGSQRVKRPKKERPQQA